jgi:ABC-type glycerol-3-phosphate transport system substrate-binding protein
MKLRPFELILVVVFGIMLILALVLLRTYEPAPEEGQLTNVGVVNIWGTLPAEGANALLAELAQTQDAYRNVSYRYVSPESFDDTFVNALADGTGPDLVLISQESLVKHRTRFEAVPYESFPVRDFRSLYVDGASIFAQSDGIYAYPIAVDPLMMYWNRDLFSFNNFVTAPVSWEEIVSDTVPALTVRDFNRTINQSGLAMGEYSNIKNAFGILSLLTLQGGSAMVTEESGRYKIRLDEQQDQLSGRPFTTAVTFYTNFNAVSNTLYSWNRSLPLDRDMFLSEELALYFGYGSEARELEKRNPNLSFDIALVPQGAEATVKRTYARFYGLAVPRTTKNKLGAYTVRQELTSQANAKKLADAYSLAPAHRSSLVAGSNDVYGRVIYEAVPVARGWLSPSQDEVSEIFTTLLGDVSSNRSSLSGAVGDSLERLQQAY